MNLREIYRSPLADLGFLQEQPILASPDYVDGLEISRSLKESFININKSLKNGVGVVEEVKIANDVVDKLYVDLQGNLQGQKRYGRIVVRNQSDGITASFNGIQGFDTTMNTYIVTANKAKASQSDVRIKFFSEMDIVDVSLAWDANGFITIVFKIKKMSLDGIVYEDMKETVDMDSVSLKDRILSLRAGVLLAQNHGIMKPAENFGINDISQPDVSQNVLADSQDKASSSSDVKSDTPIWAAKTTSDFLKPVASLVKLPSFLQDLDFNRLHYVTNPILDIDIVTAVQNVFESAASSAVDTLNDVISMGENAGKTEIMEASKLLDYALQPRHETLFIKKVTHESLPDDHPSTISMLRLVPQNVKPIAIARYKTIDAIKNALTLAPDSKLFEHLLSTPLVPITNIMPFTAQKMVDGSSVSLYSVHPQIVLGNLKAKLLAMLAEQAILTVIKDPKNTANIGDYLPGLVRYGEEVRLEAAKTAGSTLMSNALMSHGLGLEAVGLMNIPSYLDNSAYRLGQRQGVAIGGQLVYQKLREALWAQVQLPDLPDGASIDEILKIVKATADEIKATIENANKKIKDLEEKLQDITQKALNLEDQMQDLIHKVKWAAVGVSVLSFAATGSLIGGPIGAAAGAAVGLVGSLFGEL
jgi:hypothetical protein